jgi:hypothetical protein
VIARSGHPEYPGTVLPRLQDGVIVLDQYTDADAAAHLAGEDEETARRFGWWPESSASRRRSGYATRALCLQLAYAWWTGRTQLREWGK